MNWPRRRFRATAVALISCAALSISGCAQADPPAPPATTESTPSTAGAPVLTDAEALKIAVDAYQAYLDATKEVLINGADPSGVLQLTSTAALADANNAILNQAAGSSYDITGNLLLRNQALKSIQTTDSLVRIQFYTCVDTANVTTIRDGVDTKSLQPDSTGQSSVVVTVDNSETSFKTAETEPWSLADLCA